MRNQRQTQQTARNLYQKILIRKKPVITLLIILLMGCTSIGKTGESMFEAIDAEFAAGIIKEDENAAPAVHFSHKRGFYTEPFKLKIYGNKPAMIIQFTLDGSDPATSQTAIKRTAGVIIPIDPHNLRHRPVTPCVVVRTVGLLNGIVETGVKTHTYVFQEEVLALSPENVPPGAGWPQAYSKPGDPSRQTIDYGLETGYSGYNNAYRDLLVPALESIPSISLATDIGNLFNPVKGIYTHALEHGREWERPASLEILYPDDSERAYQGNTGLRIRGGWSRQDYCPKHAFRFFFRKEYGNGKLKHNLFAGEQYLAAENSSFIFKPFNPSEVMTTFDKIDLRTAQNYSWSSEGDPRFTMTRDIFSRDLQRDLGRPYTCSRYYHLYLNGAYWGLYQTQERPGENFAADYLGGKKEDWDVIKVNADDYSMRVIEATNGNLDAWQAVYTACVLGFSDTDPLQNENYYKLQGLNTLGMQDAQLKVLVDIDNLIDYMLIIFYTGNLDAPVSKFIQNQRGNNFYALYNRNDPRHGFIFLIHDAEHSLLVNNAWNSAGMQENRVDLTGEGAINEKGIHDKRYVMQVNEFRYFHPQWLHHKLTAHADYRRRFAARAKALLEGDGMLTPAACTIRFRARTKEIELAVIAESARWGNANNYRTLTKKDWKSAVERIVNSYFPYRTGIVIKQLQKAGLYGT